MSDETRQPDAIQAPDLKLLGDAGRKGDIITGDALDKKLERIQRQLAYALAEIKDMRAALK